MKNRIPVFKAELEAGIAEKIATSASIAYVVRPQKTEDLREQALAFNAVKQNMAKASQDEKNWDLFYMKDIMVSAGWNDNDDIFTLAEIMAAKDTPEDKPFNLGHNGTDIIGHIIGQSLIDDKGNPVNDTISVDELPDRVHIVSNSVIYRWWADAKRREEINQIIEEILDPEAKEPWFVSMEAAFANFDYALLDEKNNKALVVPRNSATAHLSKQLRAYGGTGTYKDYKVGRILKNITFSGKGLVKNPANKHSVIFNTTKPFFAKESLSLEDGFGYTNSSVEEKLKEKTKMTELELLKSQLDDVKASLTAEKNSKLELEKALKEVTSETSKAKLEELNKNLKDSNDRLNTTLAEVTQLKNEKAELAAKATKLETELAESKTELTKLAKAKLTADRVAKLAKEVNAEDAQSLYDVVADANLSDEKFNIYVEQMKKRTDAAYNFDKKKKDDEDKKKKGKKAKADVNLGDLDAAEPDNDADLNVGGDDNDDALAEARTSIAAYYNASRGRTAEKVKE